MVRTRVSSKLLPQLLSRPVDHVPGTLYRTHCTGYIVLSRPVDHHTLHTVSRTTSSTTDDQHQWWPNTKLIPQSPSHVSYRIFPKQQGIGLLLEWSQIFIHLHCLHLHLHLDLHLDLHLHLDRVNGVDRFYVKSEGSLLRCHYLHSCNAIIIIVSTTIKIYMRVIS